MTNPPPPRLALVGDRSPSVEAHQRIPILLDALASGADERIEPYWLHSTAVTSVDDVADFDGIWVVPGSPYESAAGVHTAIEAARTRAIPFLGTCGGFQHQLLEFAIDVCGLPDVDHAEDHPDAAELLIVPLQCDLFGEEATVVIAPGTLAGRIVGEGPTTERFFCRYGLNAAYVDQLVEHGMVISGRDEAGDARIAELPNHPFFIGSLFQPELASDPTWVHPLISGFAAAVRRHATLTVGV